MSGDGRVEALVADAYGREMFGVPVSEIERRVVRRRRVRVAWAAATVAAAALALAAVIIQPWRSTAPAHPAGTLTRPTVTATDLAKGPDTSPSPSYVSPPPPPPPPPKFPKLTVTEVTLTTEVSGDDLIAHVTTTSTGSGRAVATIGFVHRGAGAQSEFWYESPFTGYGFRLPETFQTTRSTSFSDLCTPVPGMAGTTDTRVRVWVSTMYKDGTFGPTRTVYVTCP